jgi:hypothetical protein
MTSPAPGGPFDPADDDPDNPSGTSPPVYPIMGATGMGIPDEALAAGETLEDELVSDEGDRGLIAPRPATP